MNACWFFAKIQWFCSYILPLLETEANEHLPVLSGNQNAKLGCIKRTRKYTPITNYADYLLHQLFLDHVTFFDVFFNLFILNNCVSSSDVSVKSFDNVKMESTSKGKSQLLIKATMKKSYLYWRMFWNCSKHFKGPWLQIGIPSTNCLFLRLWQLIPSTYSIHSSNITPRNIHCLICKYNLSLGDFFRTSRYEILLLQILI